MFDTVTLELFSCESLSRTGFEPHFCKRPLCDLTLKRNSREGYELIASIRHCCYIVRKLYVASVKF